MAANRGRDAGQDDSYISQRRREQAMEVAAELAAVPYRIEDRAEQDAMDRMNTLDTTFEGIRHFSMVLDQATAIATETVGHRGQESVRWALNLWTQRVRGYTQWFEDLKKHRSAGGPTPTAQPQPQTAAAHSWAPTLQQWGDDRNVRPRTGSPRGSAGWYQNSASWQGQSWTQGDWSGNPSHSNWNTGRADSAPVGGYAARTGGRYGNRQGGPYTTSNSPGPPGSWGAYRQAAEENPSASLEERTGTTADAIAATDSPSGKASGRSSAAAAVSENMTPAQRRAATGKSKSELFKKAESTRPLDPRTGDSKGTFGAKHSKEGPKGRATATQAKPQGGAIATVLNTAKAAAASAGAAAMEQMRQHREKKGTAIVEHLVKERAIPADEIPTGSQQPKKAAKKTARGNSAPPRGTSSSPAQSQAASSNWQTPDSTKSHSPSQGGSAERSPAARNLRLSAPRTPVSSVQQTDHVPDPRFTGSRAPDLKPTTVWDSWVSSDHTASTVADIFGQNLERFCITPLGDLDHKLKHMEEAISPARPTKSEEVDPEYGVPAEYPEFYQVLDCLNDDPERIAENLRETKSQARVLSDPPPFMNETMSLQHVLKAAEEHQRRPHEHKIGVGPDPICQPITETCADFCADLAYGSSHVDSYFPGGFGVQGTFNSLVALTSKILQGQCLHVYPQSQPEPWCFDTLSKCDIGVIPVDPGRISDVMRYGPNGQWSPASQYAASKFGEMCPTTCMYSNWRGALCASGRYPVCCVTRKEDAELLPKGSEEEWNSDTVQVSSAGYMAWDSTLPVRILLVVAWRKDDKFMEWRDPDGGLIAAYLKPAHNRDGSSQPLGLLIIGCRPETVHPALTVTVNAYQVLIGTNDLGRMIAAIIGYCLTVAEGRRRHFTGSDITWAHLGEEFFAREIGPNNLGIGLEPFWHILEIWRRLCWRLFIALNGSDGNHIDAVEWDIETVELRTQARQLYTGHTNALQLEQVHKTALIALGEGQVPPEELLSEARDNHIFGPNGKLLEPTTTHFGAECVLTQLHRCTTSVELLANSRVVLMYTALSDARGYCMSQDHSIHYGPERNAIDHAFSHGAYHKVGTVRYKEWMLGAKGQYPNMEEDLMRLRLFPSLRMAQPRFLEEALNKAPGVQVTTDEEFNAESRNYIWKGIIKYARCPMFPQGMDISLDESSRRFDRDFRDGEVTDTVTLMVDSVSNAEARMRVANTSRQLTDMQLHGPNTKVTPAIREMITQLISCPGWVEIPREATWLATDARAKPVMDEVKEKIARGKHFLRRLHKLHVEYCTCDEDLYRDLQGDIDIAMHHIKCCPICQTPIRPGHPVAAIRPPPKTGPHGSAVVDKEARDTSENALRRHKTLVNLSSNAMYQRMSTAEALGIPQVPSLGAMSEMVDFGQYFDNLEFNKTAGTQLMATVLSPTKENLKEVYYKPCPRILRSHILDRMCETMYRRLGLQPKLYHSVTGIPYHVIDPNFPHPHFRGDECRFVIVPSRCGRDADRVKSFMPGVRPEDGVCIVLKCISAATQSVQQSLTDQGFQTSPKSMVSYSGKWPDPEHDLEQMIKLATKLPSPDQLHLSTLLQIQSSGRLSEAIVRSAIKSFQHWEILCRFTRLEKTFDLLPCSLQDCRNVSSGRQRSPTVPHFAKSLGMFPAMCGREPQSGPPAMTDNVCTKPVGNAYTHDRSIYADCRVPVGRQEKIVRQSLAMNSLQLDVAEYMAIWEEHLVNVDRLQYTFPLRPRDMESADKPTYVLQKDRGTEASGAIFNRSLTKQGLIPSGVLQILPVPGQPGKFTDVDVKANCAAREAIRPKRGEEQGLKWDKFLRCSVEPMFTDEWSETIKELIPHRCVMRDHMLKQKVNARGSQLLEQCRHFGQQRDLLASSLFENCPAPADAFVRAKAVAVSHFMPMPPRGLGDLMWFNHDYSVSGLVLAIRDRPSPPPGAVGPTASTQVFALVSMTSGRTKLPMTLVNARGPIKGPMIPPAMPDEDPSHELQKHDMWRATYAISSMQDIFQAQHGLTMQRQEVGRLWEIFGMGGDSDDVYISRLSPEMMGRVNATYAGRHVLFITMTKELPALYGPPADVTCGSLITKGPGNFIPRWWDNSPQFGDAFQTLTHVGALIPAGDEWSAFVDIAYLQQPLSGTVFRIEAIDPGLEMDVAIAQAMYSSLWSKDEQTRTKMCEDEPFPMSVGNPMTWCAEPSTSLARRLDLFFIKEFNALWKVITGQTALGALTLPSDRVENATWSEFKHTLEERKLERSVQFGEVQQMEELYNSVLDLRLKGVAKHLPERLFALDADAVSTIGQFRQVWTKLYSLEEMPDTTPSENFYGIVTVGDDAGSSQYYDLRNIIAPQDAPGCFSVI